jgi:hypothetical protein
LEPTLDIVLHDEFGKTFEQVLPLDLGQFYEQIRKKEFTSEGHVDAELRCSAAEGPVGAPVTFTYTVDIHRSSYFLLLLSKTYKLIECS